MSAVVSNIGALFVTETATRSASVIGVYLSETVSTGAIVDLAGALAPAITLAADLTIVAAVVGSKFGKGSYGVNHYSRVATLDLAGDLAPSVSFAGNLDIVGQDFFFGDLAPVVTFAATLSVTIDLGHGDLAPSVAFSGALTGLTELAGDLPVQVALGGVLTGAVDVDGDLPVQITLAATLTAGPLWAPSTPAAPSWSPSEPCPPPMWAPPIRAILSTGKKASCAMADEEPRTGELTTANYGWIKPTVGDSDDAWGGYLNSDLDGIDSVVHGIQTSIPTVPAASATAPLMDGTASAGSSAAWSRGDHAHPSDTTKYNTSNPSGYQTAGQVSASIAAAAYVLPTASTSILGGVRVDGSTIAINSGVISAAGASITVSDTPPSSPSAGALWFNSSVGSGGGQLYVFYSDGNSSQWVPTTNQMGGGYLPLQGVTNGSDAPPGQIGEVISSVVASPGVTLTTGVSAAVTSLSLTPGDWDVTGEVWIAVGAGGATAIYAGINSGPTVPGFQAIGAARSNIFATITGSQISVLPLRSCRVSLSAMTTYYLAVIATFPSGTTTAYGNIIARRAR